MTSASKKNELAPLEKKIFDLLRRKGPLCPCQISVELLTPAGFVMISLRKLRDFNLIDVRPDRDKYRDYGESETPWGLSLSATKKRNQNNKIVT